MAMFLFDLDHNICCDDARRNSTNQIDKRMNEKIGMLRAYARPLSIDVLFCKMLRLR